MADKQEIFVATRDASWYDNPGTATKRHVWRDDGTALCSRKILLCEETKESVNDIHPSSLCGRCARVLAFTDCQ